MKRLLLLLLIALVGTATAQTPVVTARVEPDSLFIGDQFD